MPNVYQKSEISPEALGQIPSDREQEMLETELDPKTRELDLRGDVLVDQEMFRAWLSTAASSDGTCPCATSLLCFVTNLQGEDLRGSVAGDSAWEMTCRFLEEERVGHNGPHLPTVLGTGNLATVVQHLCDSGQVSV